MQSSATLLAIESSCDDTGAAVWQGGRLLSNVVASQLQHVATGGVVPEVASRAHQSLIVPVVREALTRAGVEACDLEAVAVTRGPGLLGSLVVGVSFAKAYASGLGVPLIGIHHMEAHVLAHFAGESTPPPFPFLCLTVSGGHTQLVVVNSPFEYEQIGTTLDDAAGEAFDKIGKLLGLDYPAGPALDRLAQQGEARFAFAKTRVNGLDFSFSGLKTSVLYFLRDAIKGNPGFIEQNRADLCASVQAAIVEALVTRLREAVQHTALRHVAIAGGVSANTGLRAAVAQLGIEEGVTTYLTPIRLATDNAGMIAAAASFAYAAGRFAEPELGAVARLDL